MVRQHRILVRGAAVLAVFIVLLVVLPLYYVAPHHMSHVLAKSKANSKVADEEYMTLLCPPHPHPYTIGEIDYYFEATRILAYRLLHKASTKDLDGRKLVVLTTENVLPEQIRTLRADGAIVRKVEAIAPPRGVDLAHINPQWIDQFTKLTMWNMTEYSRILYIDADILPVRPLSGIFETPFAIDTDGAPYLFAATYDSAWVRDNGHYTRPVPALLANDTQSSDEFNAGMFHLQPSREQADYVFSIYNNPPPGQSFTGGMEQDLLRYAYRDGGMYPWIRLSQMYNTQWPRYEDLETSYAVHDKMWKTDSPVHWDLRRFWYVAWGEMQGWSEERRRLIV